MSPRAAGALLLVAVATLAGCATPRGARPEVAMADGSNALTASDRLAAIDAYAAQSAREALLAAVDGWRLQGRVAFAGGGEGATARLSWVQEGDRFDIRLSAPVTGRSWRLWGGPDGATLEGFDDGPRRAADAEALLFEATGWRLPVRQLPAWVRGARGAGPASDLAVDTAGRPIAFVQDGWHLAYRDWWAGDPALPRRLFADAEGASVRLVVAEWSGLPE